MITFVSQLWGGPCLPYEESPAPYSLRPPALQQQQLPWVSGRFKWTYQRALRHSCFNLLQDPEFLSVNVLKGFFKRDKKGRERQNNTPTPDFTQRPVHLKIFCSTKPKRFTEQGLVLYSVALWTQGQRGDRLVYPHASQSKPAVNQKLPRMCKRQGHTRLTPTTAWESLPYICCLIRDSRQQMGCGRNSK